MQMNFERVLQNPRYSARALSDAIVNTPNRYRLLSKLGLFPDKGIRTTYVEIERKTTVDGILSVTARGGQAQKGTRSHRDRIMVPTQYIAYEDNVLADDVQNILMFGSDDIPESFDTVMNDKLADLYGKYDGTFEYWKWGALRGDVLDADGTSVLYNSYELTGETQADFDFRFGTTTIDGPLAAAKAVRRHLERNLRGEMMTGMVVFCHAEFMDKLTTHPTLIEYYKHQQGRPSPLVDDMFNGFVHGGVLYIEHNGVAGYVDKETGETHEHQFIPDGEAIAIPLGTRQVFRSYYAPGTMLPNVNMPGQSVYVSPKLLDHNRGIELFSESAPVFLVQKPRLVARLHSSN